MLSLFVILSLVHFSYQQCCAPEQWEGMQYSTTTTVNMKSRNVTVTKGQYFISVDTINQKVAAVGTFTLNGQSYQVKQIRDYRAGITYTETNGVCTKEPAGVFAGNCVPANATKLVSTHIGVASLSRNIDIYQILTGGYTYNLEVGQGCIPIADSYWGTAETGESVIGSTGFRGITAGIQDISAFAVPVTCANVQLSSKPDMPANNAAFGKRSAFPF